MSADLVAGVLTWRVLGKQPGRVTSCLFVEERADHCIVGFEYLCRSLYLEFILSKANHGFHHAGRAVTVYLTDAGDVCRVPAGAGDAALDAESGLRKNTVDFHTVFLGDNIE